VKFEYSSDDGKIDGDSLTVLPPDCLPASFYPELSRALTFAERLFGWPYTRNDGYMIRYKISYSEAVYPYLYIRQKWLCART
jgi:hypothetical protein